MKKKSKLFVVAAGTLALTIPAVMSIGANAPKRVYIPSGSMKPTLLVNTYIRAAQHPYRNISQVQRGDIVVHIRLNPQSHKLQNSVKRVVGLPGDKVKLSGTSISINGHQLAHVPVSRVGKIAIFKETNGSAIYTVQYGDNTVPISAFSGTVPAGKLFCLGDNRDNAFDSRYTCSVPFASVTGKKVR